MKSFLSNKHPALQPLSRQEALTCIPVISQSVQIFTTDSGDILLEYPIALRPFFKSLLERFQKNPAAPTKKLQLDQLGSCVWQLIDGKKSVRTIIETFAKKQQITLQESEQSVTLFIAELGKRGIIALA